MVEDEKERNANDIALKFFFFLFILEHRQGHFIGEYANYTCCFYQSIEDMYIIR
jgi:hypothetical protein